MCPALILHVPSFGDHVFFGYTMLACGILVSLPGTETGPLVVTAWSPNHWNARECLRIICISRIGLYQLNSLDVWGNVGESPLKSAYLIT